MVRSNTFRWFHNIQTTEFVGQENKMEIQTPKSEIAKYGVRQLGHSHGCVKPRLHVTTPICSDIATDMRSNGWTYPRVCAVTAGHSYDYAQPRLDIATDMCSYGWT